MSHVPIATPQSGKLSAYLWEHMLSKVDVNIIYMGLVIAIKGDYEAPVVCWFVFLLFDHQKEHVETPSTASL